MKMRTMSETALGLVLVLAATSCEMQDQAASGEETTSAINFQGCDGQYTGPGYCLEQYLRVKTGGAFLRTGGSNGTLVQDLKPLNADEKDLTKIDPRWRFSVTPADFMGRVRIKSATSDMCLAIVTEALNPTMISCGTCETFANKCLWTFTGGNINDKTQLKHDYTGRCLWSPSGGSNVASTTPLEARDCEGPLFETRSTFFVDAASPSLGPEVCGKPRGYDQVDLDLVGSAGWDCDHAWVNHFQSIYSMDSGDWSGSWGFNQACESRMPFARTLNAAWLVSKVPWWRDWVPNQIDELDGQVCDGGQDSAWTMPGFDWFTNIYPKFLYERTPIQRAGILAHEARHYDWIGHSASDDSCPRGGHSCDVKYGDGYPNSYQIDFLMAYAGDCRNPLAFRQQAVANANDLGARAFEYPVFSPVFPMPTDQGCYTATADWTDVSGTVVMRAYQCRNDEPSGHPVANCKVEDDYVLVGGGAEVEGEPQPGALLLQSEPGNDLATWWARSKDHWYPQVHNLRAYAIGMKLKKPDGSFIPAAELRSQMYVHYAKSCAAPGACATPHPSVSIGIADSPSHQAGDLRIGGGGYALGGWDTLQLLTASFPSGSEGWTVAAKDHIVNGPGVVEAAVIGIRRCPAGFGCLVVNVQSTGDQGVGTGYQHMTNWTTGQYATASIGGSSVGTAGRLLTDLIPLLANRGGVDVWSKDHYAVDSGYMNAFTVVVRNEDTGIIIRPPLTPRPISGRPFP